MKTLNKKLIAGAIALTLAATAATSFAKGGAEKDPTQRFNYIFTQLELNEAQQADVIAVMEVLREEHRQEMWDQRKETRDSEDRPSAEEMAALKEANRAEQTQALTDQLNTVLSPELTAELVEYLDAHRAMGMQKGQRGGKGGPNGQRQNLEQSQERN